jgi:hypothetical protein
MFDVAAVAVDNMIEKKIGRGCKERILLEVTASQNKCGVGRPSWRSNNNRRLKRHQEIMMLLMVILKKLG